MDRFWTPQHESEFQTFMAFDPQVRAWRNAFTSKYGEPPNIEDSNFDYRKAYLAGDRPIQIEQDTVPHWHSTGKSAMHPTMWKQHFYEQFGVDPDTQIDPNNKAQAAFVNKELLNYFARGATKREY